MPLRTLRPERSASAIPPLRHERSRLSPSYKWIILGSGFSVNVVSLISEAEFDESYFVDIWGLGEGELELPFSVVGKNQKVELG